MIERKIWKPLTYTPQAWESCDLSIVDDLLPAWLERRAMLAQHSPTFRAYMDRLNRRHALEGGILDRLYDIDDQVAETLIETGFDPALLKTEESPQANATRFDQLQDQVRALERVYKLAAQDEPLTTKAIRALHGNMTIHQTHAAPSDGVKRLINAPIAKGEFRRYGMQATRTGGNKAQPCPSERVEEEMEALVATYAELTARLVHPVVVAAWLLCAFNMIQPFQDGNGRIGRLLASYVLIKEGLFLLHVSREAALVIYPPAFAAAEAGNPGPLIALIARQQRQHLEAVLCMRAFGHETPLLPMATALRERLAAQRDHHAHAVQADPQFRRTQLHDLVADALHTHVQAAQEALGTEASLSMGSSGQPGDPTTQHSFSQHAAAYARLHQYQFNASHPQSFLQVNIQVGSREYRLVVLLHHYGYGPGTLAIGGIVSFTGTAQASAHLADPGQPSTALDCPPFLVALNDVNPLPAERLHAHVGQLLAAALAEVASVI